MLQVNGLTKTFGSVQQTQVLKGVDMNIKQGEMAALMGPSTPKKSTLLNIIGGLSLVIQVQSCSETKNTARKPISGRCTFRIGWLDFPRFPPLDNLTRDNVAMAFELSGMQSHEAVQAAMVALEKVGLGDRMHFIPDQLSGGQQQRVAIARAIAGNRPVLLADEPTGNLDIASGKEVMALFKELCHDEDNPVSILMVTHDPDLASNADRMLLLNDGRTEASDIRSAWGLDDEEGGEEE